MPGGPVVKRWGFSATDPGSITGQELRSHEKCGAGKKKKEYIKNSCNSIILKKPNPIKIWVKRSK